MKQLVWFGLVAATGLHAQPASPEFFEMRVRPVLAKNCFGCHAESAMGGLQMTSREALLKGGKRGAALVPGAADSSLLVRAIRHEDAALKMPPSGKLTPAEIDDIVAWVAAGAIWPATAPPTSATSGKIKPEQRQWWAFQPVREPNPPPVRNALWVRTPIDRFVVAKLEERNLTPAPPAPRRALIRRAYYDLTGLPPTVEEVEQFLADKSPNAFEKVVDRLLDSPHYGERWGRYWLDVARYSDDRLNSTQDDPYPNAWRYRDWVIRAFNDDMPYDLFVKAQIAGDQLAHPKREQLMAGLGFYALSPEFQDDRVDATTRGFLAMTAACAQCHDHKFDPIPTKDYYALLGVFTSTRLGELPLAPEPVVQEYKSRKARIDEAQKELDDYLDRQASQLAEVLAAQAARYLRAVVTGASDGLDAETLARWKKYLTEARREHPFLDGYDQPGFDAEAFQTALLGVIKEKHAIDRTNLIRLGGSDVRSDLASADLLSLERDKYFLWRDMVGKDRFGKFESGILYYKEGQIDRYLSGEWKRHLDTLRARLEQRKKELPEQYPFFHIVEDVEQPKNERIHIRGSRENLGEEAPRAFLSVLCEGEPKPFTRGSGRLELAEAIASSSNPLTARVIVNRVWMHHFGTGIVATPSNFGQLGEKPSHPELLDYLAARLVEQGWSLKKLHREIMLSAVYQRSSQSIEANLTADPENRLLWRYSRRRLDIEPLRDTLLKVTGELEATAGGPPLKMDDPANKRRTVYTFVSRRKLDGTLSLFDFPNPNSLAEQRIQTATPLQQLFFLNSEFIEARAQALAARLETAAADMPGKIRAAYRALYQRDPTAEEVRLGTGYLGTGGRENWVRFAQALLGANELLFVN
jgi:mono/diheme cytochrome c family protein/SOS-response transcriptional repressor LexA